MKFGKILSLGLVAATAAAVACSSGTHPTPSSGPVVMPSGNESGVGALGMNLSLPGGQHISTLTYTLANAANTYTGTYSVDKTGTLSFTIGSVAAGPGYKITLSATTDDGKDICSFPQQGAANTSNITVANRTTTVVNLNLQCVVAQGLDAGNVVINATESNCPVWNTIVGNPYNITIDSGANVNDSGTLGTTALMGGATPTTALIQSGQSLVLVGSATAPNPGALSFNWSFTGAAGATLAIPGGSTGTTSMGIIDPNSTDAGTSNQAVFTCPPNLTATQNYTINLDLTDGPDANVCDPSYTHGSIPVQCQSLTPCSGPGEFGLASAGCTGNDPAGYALVASTVADAQGQLCCIGSCNDTGPHQTAGACPAGFTAVGLCCQPVVPCTTAGQTNCVPCDHSRAGNNLCTGTEAVLVQRDIDKGLYTGTTLNPFPGTGASCYECLISKNGLDKPTATNKECEDGLTVGTAAQCINVLNCITGNPQGLTSPGVMPTGPGTPSTSSPWTACANNSTDGYANCFCGVAEPDTTDCSTAQPISAHNTGALGAASPNGSCAEVILAGVGDSDTTSPGQVLTDIGVTTSATGRALSIMGVAGTQVATPACGMCFQ